VTPRRRFAYISVVRINERIHQIKAERPRWARGVAGGGLQVMGTGFNYQLATESERESFYRNLAAIEKELMSKTGTVDRPEEYFYGRIPLYFLTFDEVIPAVAYYTGAATKTVLMLAGPLDRLVGRHRDDSKSRENATQLPGEPEVAVAVAEAKRRADPSEDTRKVTEPEQIPWPEAVLRTYQWCEAAPNMEPKQMEFLARRDVTPRAIGAPGQPEFALIGKPLYVAEPD
jgi:hypothetical protein